MHRKLTIAEISQRSGLGVSTHDHWRIDGLGPPSQRLDGRISYDEEAFEARLAVYRQSSIDGERG
jgi:DNA-binding transcriptional MerR regulator